MHEVLYTEPLIRRAIQRSIIRLLGRLYFIAMGLLGVSLLLSAVQNHAGWFVGVTGTALFCGLLVPVVAIRAHTRAAMSRLVQMENGAASVGIDEERLRLASALGSIDIPLSRVTAVWRYPDCWVLLAGRSILMTLPTETIPEATRDQWLRQLEDAGAIID